MPSARRAVGGLRPALGGVVVGQRRARRPARRARARTRSAGDSVPSERSRVGVEVDAHAREPSAAAGRRPRPLTRRAGCRRTAGRSAPGRGRRRPRRIHSSLEQQRRRGRPEHQPQPAAVAPRRRTPTGRRRRRRRWSSTDHSGIGWPSMRTLACGGPSPISAPGSVRTQAGAPRAEADAGLLGDHGQLDDAVEVAGPRAGDEAGPASRSGARDAPEVGDRPARAAAATAANVGIDPARGRGARRSVS